MRTWGLRVCLAFILVQVAASTIGAQTKRALLIGIDTYQPAGTTAQHPETCVNGKCQGCAYNRCDLSAFDNLYGTLNDVLAMRDLLIRKFGFPRDKVFALTNPALPVSQMKDIDLSPTETTHDGILSAMKKYLVDEPQSGDTVVFYYSGHGSLRINSKGTKITVEENGILKHADSTIVPSDAWKGAFDVRDREMTRIFNSALDKGVKLTVILDSCYSGGLARGIPLKGIKVRKRWVPYDPRDINEGPDLLSDAKPRPAPSERADNPALIFSATQQDQTAQELSLPEGHGLFTSSLIKALQMFPANTPASVIKLSVMADMEGSEAFEQVPSLDAGIYRRDQPLFGGAPESAGTIRTAAVGVDLLGNVVLDAGKLAGIGPDSEFTSLTPAAHGQKTIIKVTDLVGISRSKAIVTSPSDAKVDHGEIFELTKWVPPPSPPLHLWTWPSNLSQAQVVAAAAQVKLSAIESVDDPVEQIWTDMLLWDGTQWVIQHAGSDKSMPIGPVLTAASLKSNAPPGAKVWVNLPAPKELAAKLDLRDPRKAIEGVPDVTNADYLLAGSLSAAGASWAWLHKAEFLSGPQTTSSGDHEPGCSTSSRYPVRTGWIPLVPKNPTDPNAASQLNSYASRLSKLNGWFNLLPSPAEATSQDYYNLAFIRSSDHKVLANGEPTKQDDDISMVLTPSANLKAKRWVYILDIDCQGNGQLIYPTLPTGNQFPNNAKPQGQVTLGDGFTIARPYGLDTFVFLSTPQALPDPQALNFDGVKGVVGVSDPLQRLLEDTSAGTRGVHANIPMDWGISFQSMRTLPK